MKIGIVGFGREGKVALEYWGKHASKVFVYDKDTSILLPAQCFGRLGQEYKKHILEDAPSLDLIVRSPGISLWEIEEKIPTPITTITREFFDQCPCPIIGITGTKGKGTTATLIYEILKADGKDVHLVGNIGTPALSVLPNLNKDSIVVYELSSFQLFDLHKSPHVAVCLLVTEDHLDWHKDLAQYHRSKGNIFAHQVKDDTAIWFTENQTSASLSMLSSAQTKIPYGANGTVYVSPEGFFCYKDEVICAANTARLPGVHNQENICAAIAATWGMVKKESILKVVKAFPGLPFHIETIATHNDITFINDSFATNPTATEVAILSMEQPTTLLIGGVDRGLHLEPFVYAIQKSSHIKNIICFGEEGPRIKEMLEKHDLTSVQVSGPLTEVFDTAIRLTEKDEVVLFSPGAPSFDMFANYTERGNAFNELVAKYIKGLL